MLRDYDDGEQTIEELSAQVQRLKAAILEKKDKLASLEVEIKDVNLELFMTSAPSAADGTQHQEEEKKETGEEQNYYSWHNC